MNSTSLLVYSTDLHGLNTKLEHLFLKVLNIYQIYPIASKVCFVKILANLHNICLQQSHICPNNLYILGRKKKHTHTHAHDRLSQRSRNYLIILTPPPPLFWLLRQRSNFLNHLTVYTWAIYWNVTLTWNRT